MAEYGWRGSILFISGILFNTLPCALLLNSPQVPTPDDIPEPVITADESKSKIPTELENGHAGHPLLTKQLNGVLNPSLGSKNSINIRGHTMSSFSLSSAAKDYKLKPSSNCEHSI